MTESPGASPIDPATPEKERVRVSAKSQKEKGMYT
jgi:hypothetical protein